MTQNLNIIKIVFLFFLFTCQVVPKICPECKPVFPTVNGANQIIDLRHKALEERIKQYYDANINLLLETIDTMQKEIAQNVVHITTLETEANIDEKKLLFLLQQNSQLNSILGGE